MRLIFDISNCIACIAIARIDLRCELFGTGSSIFACVIVTIVFSQLGMFQIMGFHWERLGYKSAVDFVLTLSKGEPEQLEAFVRFIETDARLLNAIRTGDWALFAEVYNGPGYKKNNYDTKIRDRKKYWDRELAAWYLMTAYANF